MKIFLSWSGDRSRALAELLSDWIPNVIQTVECFFSSSGIRAGDRWNEEINTQLEATNFGILCVTPDNLNAPWLNYEAGALAKRVTAKSRVVPITMGFDPSTLPAPLRQFNGARDDHAGFKNLIRSIAEAAESSVDVDQVFDVWWPVLRPKLAQLPDSVGDSPPPSPPSTEEILSEVLGIVQGLQKDVVRLRDRDKFRDAEALNPAVFARFLASEPGLLHRLSIRDSRLRKSSALWAKDGDEGQDFLLHWLSHLAAEQLTNADRHPAPKSGEQPPGARIGDRDTDEDDSPVPDETED